MEIEAESLDLVSADVVRDPHRAFAALRRHGPIHWLERHKAWLLMGYEHVRRSLQDDEFSTDTITPLYSRLSAEERERFRAAAELFRGWMIFNDPPVHTALRKPVASAFTPAGVAKLRDDIFLLADRMLEDLDDVAEVDFVSEFAFKVPTNVIAVLLGVPEERFDDMREWSRQLGSLIMGKVSRSDAWARALDATEEMQVYFAELIAAYSSDPDDNLISRMIDAVGGQYPLTHEQLVGACSLLLFGGHETTTSLLATGVLHLSQQPGARERIGEQAGIEAAVEELLRYDGPSKILVRRVRYDCSWQGHDFRKGQAVFCATMAANRDPSVFEAPARFVIDRSPNRHLGFGFARHFCLGAQLARLEAQVILPLIFRRFPELRLACAADELTYHPTVVGRTLRELPIVLR